MASAITTISGSGVSLQGVGRLVIGLVGGLVATFLLVWLMATLVQAGRTALTEPPKQFTVSYVAIPNPPKLQTKSAKPTKPVQPKVPDTMQMQMGSVKPAGVSVNIGNLGMNTDLSLNQNTGLAITGGNYLPIVKVAPVYPPSARSAGIEGWVLASYTVTKTGAVTDVVVLDAKPEGVFEEAAINAALNFKYKPRVVAGKPVPVHGVRQLFTFKLEE